ncbi:MAG: HAD family hydrolase [Kiritimatiellae bacterium]|nr:HAD family hydrolase [Kiritimatiellia bacterium]
MPTQASNRQEHPRAAVFLDRDGTIIEDRGDLSDPAQVVFFKDTVPALRRLAEKFALFVVTNQSGVAKGTITIEDVQRVNDYVEKYLAINGAPIAATYVCPHQRYSDCQCIKPNPYFLKKAEREFGIDLRRSFVIGDHPHDVELATRVEATGIYLLSGHGMKHRADLPVQTIVVDGIREATEQVLTRGSGQQTERQTANWGASPATPER